MSEKTEGFWAGLRQFIEAYSPLDFVLIFEHFDRFLWGCWVTLELREYILVFRSELLPS